MPKNWSNKNITLHFGSISGAAYIWLNGKAVGFSKVSKTPAEFNITPYLREGDNVLAVQVLRWHDGSYLEDQDMWRLSGIERHVFLRAKDKIHINDFWVKCGLDDTYKDGTVKAAVSIPNAPLSIKSKFLFLIKTKTAFLTKQNLPMLPILKEKCPIQPNGRQNFRISTRRLSV